MSLQSDDVNIQSVITFPIEMSQPVVWPQPFTANELRLPVFGT